VPVETIFWPSMEIASPKKRLAMTHRNDFANTLIGNGVHVSKMVKLGNINISGTTDHIVPEIQNKKDCANDFRLRLILPW
jgi:hypothetical protein